MIGYAGVTFLHRPDGALANDLALREQLVREIRTFRPDAVLATDPETIFHGADGVNHTDHRAAGMAAVDAVYPAARNPMAFPWLARGGLAAHRVRRLYLFWTNHPDAWVDVTATLDRKLEALPRPREPDPRLRGADRRVRELGRRGRHVDRRHGGRGLPAHRDRPTTRRRTRRPPSGPERATPACRSALLEQQRADAAPAFQTSASASARRPSIVTSSPSVRSPADAGEVLVGGDRDVAE